MSRPRQSTRLVLILVGGALLAGVRCSSPSGSTPGGNQGGSDAASGSGGGGPAGSTGSGSGGDSGSGGATVTGSGGSTVGTGGGIAGDAAGSGGASVGAVDNWPQAGGPDGTFHANVTDAPTTWSVATSKNILWRTNLDNEGQGGIAVSGDLLFLTTFLPFSGAKNSLSIEGYAIDRKTGAIKWRTKPLVGNGEASGMAYQYSDATSWTPIADGKYVWFFNSTGHMGAWDITGTPDAGGVLAPIWEANFAGQNPTFPYNRQHEPFMIGNDVVILSPLGMGMGDPAGKTAGWNYLHGIDKMTGKTTWVADDASTFYNTALMGKLPDGTPAVLHGRGGPHNVPERPVGLSLTSLAPGSMGKSLWQYVSGGPAMCTGGSATTPGMCTGGSGTALYNTSFDDKYAYWFTEPQNEILTVLDVKTGKPVHGWSLSKLVDIRRWNVAMNKYETLSGVNVNTMADWEYSGMMHVVPDWFSNVVANGYVWFLTVTNNNDRWGTHTGPPHCVGRVNAETGKVEYLEVPVGVQRAAGMPEKLLYGMNITTTAMDAKGNDVAEDATRSHSDGWSTPAFSAAPIVLGNKIYFSTQLGITYVIDATAKVLDENAILGYGDLGSLGQTWSLAGPAYASGVMYHHSSKEVVAISAGAAAAK